MKHINGGHCPRCHEILLTCHVDLAYWFWRAREAFPTMHISDGFRNKAQQDACCNAKPPTSTIRWPNSKHNHMEGTGPCSLAMDLFRLLDDGKGEWRPGFFVQIAQWFEENGAPLKWGGNFTVPDRPHFELKPKSKPVTQTS